MSTWMLVALGAAVGAPARYLVDRAVPSAGGLPWGMLLVNVTGSLALGLVVGLGQAHELASWVMPALGVGFCGAFTTYSTFAHDTVRLAEAGARSAALANVVLSVVLGVGAAAAGIGLGAQL